MKLLQVQQNTILRKLVGAQWYVSNETIHRDLRVETIDELAQKLTTRFEAQLHKHPETLALQLLEDPKIRRLRRPMPFDHV